jgi:hypothetical protein
VSLSSVAAETHGLTRDSVERARGIDFATAGSRLAPHVEAALDTHGQAIDAVRSAVDAALATLGPVGGERGLFYLAADCATTAAIDPTLTGADRAELRELWEGCSHTASAALYVVRPVLGWATGGQQRPQNPNDPKRTRLAPTRIPERSNALHRTSGVVS